MVLRIGHIHRRNSRLWMSSTIVVSRFSVDTGWAVVYPQLAASVQMPRSSSSSQDEDVAGPEEVSEIVIYVPTSAEIAAGDRIDWDGDTWVVNTIADRRSDEPYHRYTASKHQIAVIEQSISFRRISVNDDGVIVGTRAVGTFDVKFTRGIESQNLSLQPEDTALGSSVQGVFIAPLEAGVLAIGDTFVRDGMPGRVRSIDRSAPDHIEFGYTMETAVA